MLKYLEFRPESIVNSGWNPWKLNRILYNLSEIFDILTGIFEIWEDLIYKLSKFEKIGFRGTLICYH